MELMPFVIALLPTIFTGMMMFYWQRAQGRRDKKREKAEDEREERIEARAEARRQESLLNLNLSLTNLKLTEETAKAVKNGSCNGTMDAALAACQESKKAYFDFINGEAISHLHEK